MSSDSANFESATCTFNVGETTWNPSEYRCHLAILREGDGSFSAIVLNLPGAGSCGDSEAEAIENAVEAVTGVIMAHKDAGDDIPWKAWNSYSVPEGAKQKWILVNV